MTDIQTISREGLKEIYDIACSNWQRKLRNYLSSLDPFCDKIPFHSDQVIEMFGAATSDQLLVIQKYFVFPFKIGDWVVTTTSVDAGYEKPNIDEMFQITDIRDSYAYFAPCRAVDINRLRLATPEEITKNSLKDGTPCWVRDSQTSEWRLRYSDGAGRFYPDQKKSGMTITWKYYMPYEPNKLPIL